MSNRSSHFRWRWLALGNGIGQWQLIVDGKDALNHRHFLVIFVQFAIEIVVVDLIEERDVLLEGLAVGARGNVHEVLLVEGDGTNTRLQIVVDAFARRVVWAHRYIFGDESNDRFLTLCELVCKFKHVVWSQIGEVRAVIVKLQVSHMDVVLEHLNHGRLLVELLGALVIGVEDGFGRLDGHFGLAHFNM